MSVEKDLCAECRISSVFAAPTTTPSTTAVNTSPARITDQSTTQRAETPAGTTTVGSPIRAVCEAVQSGAFDDPATWSENTLPSDNCNILIPAGITVTFNGATVDINSKVVTVEGAAVVRSTGSVGFTFPFGINVIVRGGGSLNDQTDNNRIYCRPDSIFTFLDGSSFTGTNTVVSTYTGAVPSDGLEQSLPIGSSFSGPFTFAVPVDGSIQTYDSIMCQVRASGSFTSGFTWLGGIAPSFDFCNSVGGCGLNIPTGFTLSTASLNGELNIPFNSITVSAGSFFQLGTPGLIGGFRFRFGTTLGIFGSLQYSSADAAGIFIPFGSQFNFFAGASFSSGFTVPVSIFDPATSAVTGSSLSLTNGYSSPTFIDVSNTGVTVVDTNRKCRLRCLWRIF